MKSPKLKKKEKELFPRTQELQEQIQKTKALLEQLHRELDNHLIPVRKMQEAEKYLVLEFNQHTSFNVYGIQDDGYIPWRSPNVTLWHQRYHDWELVDLGETSEDRKMHVYVAHWETPDTEAIPKAEDIMINSGYRFIPCTWLEDHHVQIHWPEDLR